MNKTKKYDFSGLDEIDDESKVDPVTEEVNSVEPSIIPESKYDFSGLDEITEPEPVIEPEKGKIEKTIDYLTPSEETQSNVYDIARGGAEGVTLGASGELAGLGFGALETAERYIPGTNAYKVRQLEESMSKPDEFGITGKMDKQSFIDRYRQYENLSEAEDKASQERSPWLYGAGQLGGGLLTGTGITALTGVGAATKTAKGAKSIYDISKASKLAAAKELLKRSGSTYLKAAPAIAAESALTSKEDLIGENANPEGVVRDTLGGLSFGAAGTLGLHGITEYAGPMLSKAAEAVKETALSRNNPKLRQIAETWTRHGKQLKTHPASQAAELGGLSKETSDNATNVMNDLLGMRKSVGQDVGNSIKNATSSGVTIDISGTQAPVKATLTQLLANFPNIPKAKAALDRISKGGTKITPLEAQELIHDMDAYDNLFQSIGKGKLMSDIKAQGEISDFKNQLTALLRKSVPDYSLHADRYIDANRVIEQVLSGATDLDITKKFFGNEKTRQNLHKKLVSMIEGAQSTGGSAATDRSAFTRYEDALKNFQNKELTRASQGQIPAPAMPSNKSAQTMGEDILKYADTAALRRDARAVKDSQAATSSIVKDFVGKQVITGTYVASRAHSVAQDLSKLLYKAPAAVLNTIADRLEKSGGKTLSGYGTTLKSAIKTGDVEKKNKALFLILSNPGSKLFISAEDLKDEEKME